MISTVNANKIFEALLTFTLIMRSLIYSLLGAYYYVYYCQIVFNSCHWFQRCFKFHIHSETGVKQPLKIVKTKSLWRSKALQNAHLGAFCNAFDLHKAIFRLENMLLGLPLSDRFRQVSL